jgi:DNA-binding transcriptional regulator LsrR (DeoR family)
MKKLAAASAVKPRPAPSRTGPEDPVIEAAWLYYNDGLNQHAVAARLGVSRATVVNYLQEARERGLIRIHLADAPFRGHRLALDLAERFGLEGAYVVPTGSGGDADQLRRVARGAAEWLPALVGPGDVLGVAWGRTVFEVGDLIEPTTIPDLTVVQLTGSMASPYGFTAELCSARLAQRLGATCINLHVPALLSDARLAEALRREPVIAAQLDALTRCTTALFAAGSCTKDSHIVGAGIARPDDLEAYVAAGAKGVLSGRFIDGDGRAVAGHLDDRTVGIGIDDLRAIPTGILVSVGPDKVIPMLATLTGGFASHCVTDTATAEAILRAAG